MSKKIKKPQKGMFVKDIKYSPGEVGVILSVNKQLDRIEIRWFNPDKKYWEKHGLDVDDAITEDDYAGVKEGYVRINKKEGVMYAL